MLHKDSSLGWRHAIHNWEVADSAALAALSVVAADIGKIAFQIDTGTWYILTDNSPVTWATISINAPVDAEYIVATSSAGLSAERVLAVAGAALSLVLSSGLITVTLATDTDGTLAANSDGKLATQKAVKTYVDAALASADAVVYKGVIDCSANPNYPAADAGYLYRVSVAGKIGGASGPNVEIGDSLLCTTDGTVSGNHVTVGNNWNIVQVNLDGAVLGPTSATDGYLAAFDGTTGKLIKQLTPSAVRTLLSLVVGTDVQAYDADLATIAGLTATTDNFIQSKSSAWASRTPAQVAADLSSLIKPKECIEISCSDVTTALTTGTAKVTFFMPYDFTVTEVFTAVGTQSSSGVVTADLNKAGTSIFSTNPSIDASEDTSLTGTVAVISTASLSKGDKMTVDIDAAGTGAKQLTMYIIGKQT